MKSRSDTETRRARPLLGTIVDLCCDGSPNELEAAFVVIKEVHRLMSFFDFDSDVSRMNRGAFHESVRIHPWTWRVLKAAQEFARASAGFFDATAAQLGEGSWRDVVLEENFAVRFRRRVIVDLGGIAKGFAVDRAVDSLKENGVTRGIVNAGGDIRVFGAISREVCLRNPISPAQFSGILRVRNRAVATSGTYFSRRALIDGKTRGPMTDLISVTVAAKDCMTADALTKVVFALREKAAPLLMRYRADALLLERNGAPSWMFHSLCDTRDRTRFD
jgi:thiamine biosynthesis lipoprotein